MTEHSTRLYNEDLAPAKERHWGTFSIVTMWMSTVHSLGGYAMAAGLFMLGLAAWQVLAALLLGMAIACVLMTLSGFAGQRTGAPFPVLARISFGVFGGNLPAVVRGITGIAWYGIQTWLASSALVVLAVQIAPGLSPLTSGGFLGLSFLGWVSFAVMWFLQLLVVRRGMERIRKFQHWAGPTVWVVMLFLALWIAFKTGGRVPWNFGTQNLSGGQSALLFFTGVSLTIAYVATLLLNFSDFSRFAPDRRSVRRGNFWGLMVNWLAFVLVVVFVTAGSIKVFGRAITNPVDLVAAINNPVITIVGASTFMVATIGINVVCNSVSPAYDVVNLMPKHIDFKRGALISAVIAFIILPWNLYSSAVAVNYFLGAIGAILGPLFGIMFVDYYMVRKQRVALDDLYSDSPSAAYYYHRGWNPRAVAALIPSALVAIIAATVPTLHDVAAFSWPIGAVLAAGIYVLIAKDAGESRHETRFSAPEEKFDLDHPRVLSSE
ncbi:NCS1 family nucleobase:cation symporter-1 [Arthrobacter sp. STN4]|uniref:NCS1 family nucleobase:cation symporter-1 n=1 Tax=Arthrobacter sp. STN4 TaxID=2923276 RepID=UPI00211A5BFA|nr:NCS1 family nucleobase:cation symporter-1 [Arthrobacter sp. STN4]MCQ9165475.1 NCS1 family nucleobase:cation symporter-1 [Arthrobacter sp. STN4]